MTAIRKQHTVSFQKNVSHHFVFHFWATHCSFQRIVLLGPGIFPSSYSSSTRDEPNFLTNSRSPDNSRWEPSLVSKEDVRQKKHMQCERDSCHMQLCSSCSQHAMLPTQERKSIFLGVYIQILVSFKEQLSQYLSDDVVSHASNSSPEEMRKVSNAN